MTTPFCSNCGIKNDYEHEVCRDCVKKLCTSLDGMPQLDGNFYGDQIDSISK